MCSNLNLNPNTIAAKRIDRYPGRPTIIFLHDSLGCIALWKDFPQELAGQAQCNALIYDRQGYGKSAPFTTTQRANDYLEREADILGTLLDFWDIDTAILFGHSDGGSIALLAAAKYPEKIKAVITEGAHIFVEDITVNSITEAVRLYRETDLKTKLEKYHGEKTEAMFWAWAHTWTTEKFRSWNIESFLPSINCPLLIIQGEDDEYGSLDQVKRISDQATNVTKFIIPQIKHTPHKEVPELIIHTTAAFLEEYTI